MSSLEHPKENSSDMLTLDVGGEIIRVSRRVLTQFKDSMLAVRFSGRWDSQRDHLYETILIDQDIRIFGPLINYLRAKAIETPGRAKSAPSLKTFGGNTDLYGDFLRLVDYYGLTQYFYNLQIVPIDEGIEEEAIMYTAEGVSFDRVQPQRFFLQPLVEGLRVASFETIFEDDLKDDVDAKNFEIGWVDLECLLREEASEEWYRSNKSKQYTGWIFRGDRMSGGKICCNIDDVYCEGVYKAHRKYKMSFPMIPVGHVAVFGGKGKWRLVNVEWEELTECTDDTDSGDLPSEQYKKLP